jgi:hypothetical protein
MPETFTILKLSDDEFSKLADSLQPVVIPLEQSSSWGAFDSTLPGRKFLGSFRYDEDGLFVALASATLYQQRGRDWIWIKHGPVFASVPTTETIKKMCATLIKQFREIDGIRPTFVRLSSPTFSSPLKKPFEHTMYDQTVELDLTQDEDTIWFGMSQTARQEIKKAEKKGVAIGAVAAHEAAEVFEKTYYPLLRETSSRSNFGIHPASVYASMLKHLPHANMYVASLNKKPVAWAIITTYRGRGLYYYGASGETARTTGAAYLLQWHIIKHLKRQNVTTYDLMGIAGRFFPALKSVTNFKMKFSKNVVDVPMAYDLPIQPLKYALLKTALKTKRILR